MLLANVNFYLVLTYLKLFLFFLQKKRAIKTGRVVPETTLDEAIQQVPVSVEKLAPLADYFCEIDNSQDSGEITLKTPGVTWELFQINWLQTCPWPQAK